MKGFRVLCPYCGDPDNTVRINLNDLRSCECSSCGKDFSAETAVKHLRDQASRWERVAKWVESAAEVVAE